MLKSIIAVSASLIGGAHAFWRMECPGRVGLARLDPIINPGSISMHSHSIHGSSAFASDVNTADLLNADCTSCRVTQDKSAYWHPALYFQDEETGEFELVPQVGGMLAYYLLIGENVTAFPPDFRMLSGTNERRTYTAGDPSQPDPGKSEWNALGETDQDTLAQRALGFNCLNYERDPEGTLYRHYMPDKAYMDANCKNGMRLEIMFPSCWKGGDALDSDNHKDHVAFPDLVMTGTCPSGYPVRLPSLMYEVIWNTYAFVDRAGRFVFANGDPTGYGYHADFIMGWEEEFLQSAINTCTNESGRIQDCPLFNVVSEDEAKSCEMKLPQALAKEDVEGPMKQLPGGDEITYGGDSDEGDEEATNSIAPTLTYAPGKLPENSASPLPGQVFKETSVYVAPAQTTSQQTSTLPEPSSTLAATTSIQTSTVPEVGAAEATLGAEAVQPPVESSSIATSVETSLEPTTAEAPTTTTAPEPIEETDTKSFYSTQFITNGNIVSKILWEEERVYVTELQEQTVVVTVTSTVTAAPSPAVPRRRRRSAHLHRHGHRHI